MGVPADSRRRIRSPPDSSRRTLSSARAVLRSGHTPRVTAFSAALARAAELDIDPYSLRTACEFHDLGAIAVPRAVLFKKGPLTREELLQVQQHPIVGRRILQAAPSRP